MRLVLLLCAFAAPASSVLGQHRPRPVFADSSAERVMAHVGYHANVPWFIDMLRQASGPYSQARLGELADSLVARAIDPQAIRTDAIRYRIADDGVSTLVSSGSREEGRGQPYSGALDRLIKIHKQAADVGIRRKVLAGLLGLPDRTRALAYIETVAESTDPTAAAAVNYLISDANGESWSGVRPTPEQAQASTAALHDLASRHRVSNSQASYLLRGWIAMHP